MSGSGKHHSSIDFSHGEDTVSPNGPGFSDAGVPFAYDTHSPVIDVPLAIRNIAHSKQAGLSDGYCLLSPELSAKRTFTALQAFLLALLISVGVAGLYWRWEATIIIGSLIFSGFYLCVVLFRLGVLAAFEKPAETTLSNSKTPANGRYIILVALYKEASQVAALVRSLSDLRWHAGQKEIHLICEADDHDTIAAIRALGRADIHLDIVPEGHPRTKPRALNYVLQQVHGDYLVLYDAEDRPHPDQLLEAAAAFEQGSEALSCLQAPLSIDNRRESLIARFFAIEYDTLFRGILPVLAKWRAPMPLGGTSNHFKLSHLIAAGGWDSFNVTEDADLGIRLARCGLDCSTITRPTHEEAPAQLKAWMNQRTRWIKGWLQTLLVHLRNPLTTYRQMGARRFIQFHMVLTAVVISVLVHPFFLVAFVWQMISYFQELPQSGYGIWITGISTFNLVAGYLSYGLLAWTVQDARGSRSDKAAILFFPVYWLLISAAGWRAVAQLLFRPHYWSKTEHGSSNRQTPRFDAKAGEVETPPRSIDPKML